MELTAAHLMRMRRAVMAPVFVACIVGVPARAFGQAAVAGAVQDVTGAALPGVIVEARGPALIEKVRTATTEGSGHYRIEALPPGLYTVTFSLAGWSSSVRSAIELTGSFTATVDAQLGVAPLAEAVTIIGQVPLVDLHRSTHELDARRRHRQGDSDGSKLQRGHRSRARRRHECERYGDGHGDDVVPHSRRPQNEGRLSLDGLTIGSPPSGNSATSYVWTSAKRRK